jgi:hypothetical protein
VVAMVVAMVVAVPVVVVPAEVAGVPPGWETVLDFSGSTTNAPTTPTTNSRMDSTASTPARDLLTHER